MAIALVVVALVVFGLILLIAFVSSSSGAASGRVAPVTTPGMTFPSDEITVDGFLEKSPFEITPAGTTITLSPSPTSTRSGRITLQVSPAVNTILGQLVNLPAVESANGIMIFQNDSGLEIPLTSFTLFATNPQGPSVFLQSIRLSFI